MSVAPFQISTNLQSSKSFKTPPLPNAKFKSILDPIEKVTGNILGNCICWKYLREKQPICQICLSPHYEYSGAQNIYSGLTMRRSLWPSAVFGLTGEWFIIPTHILPKTTSSLKCWVGSQKIGAAHSSRSMWGRGGRGGGGEKSLKAAD